MLLDIVGEKVKISISEDRIFSIPGPKPITNDIPKNMSDSEATEVNSAIKKDGDSLEKSKTDHLDINDDAILGPKETNLLHPSEERLFIDSNKKAMLVVQ